LHKSISPEQGLPPVATGFKESVSGLPFFKTFVWIKAAGGNLFIIFEYEAKKILLSNIVHHGNWL
jgi:hypothetical protein